MCGRLIGHHVRRDPEAHQLRENVGRVAEQCNGASLASSPPGLGFRQRVRQAVGPLVHVARRQPALDAARVHFDDQGHAAVHGHGERLGAAHPAQAGGDDEASGEGAVEGAAGEGCEGLVGALQNSLCADVNPAPGRHLPVHRQAAGFEIAEPIPRRPGWDEQRVRNQHARRPLVRAKDGDGLAGLHDERLVVIERAQRRDDRIERCPVASGLAGSAVDDQLVGALGDVGVEIVHEHPQRGFLWPAFAGD